MQEKEVKMLPDRRKQINKKAAKPITGNNVNKSTNLAKNLLH
jgi:hypothetical protein